MAPRLSRTPPPMEPFSKQTTFAPSSTTAQPHPKTSALVLRCATAVTLALAAYWLLNYAVFPLCDPIFIWTREVSAGGGGLGLALLAFGEVTCTPLLSVGALIPLVALLLWAVVQTRAASPDGLFKLSILFCIAGFLLIGVDGSQYRLAEALLSCGTGFFEIFMFFMLAALANKNPVAALPLFAWGEAVASWGTILGANFGRLVNPDAAAPISGSFIVALVVFAIVAYVIIPRRGIDFSETVQRLAPHVPAAPVEADRSASELLRERCRSLGDARGLTEREQQVFECLARGRNVRFIQEKLVVSYNTAKTHVSHIYAKMGVHSHQELIDLVEQRD